jgi:hypothetical protein
MISKNGDGPSGYGKKQDATAAAHIGRRSAVENLHFRPLPLTTTTSLPPPPLLVVSETALLSLTELLISIRCCTGS